MGRSLVTEAVAFSKQCGYRPLFLWTLSRLHPARRMYETLGFKKTEGVTHLLWGKLLTEERYEPGLQDEQGPHRLEHKA